MRKVLIAKRYLGRTVFALAAIGLYVVVCHFDASAAAPGKRACAGRNLLGDIQSNDPAAYAQLMTRAARTKNDGAVFWRITRGASPASYLLGTLHLTDYRVTTLSPLVRSVVRKARVVALEVADLSPAMTAAAITTGAGLVLFKNGQRLDRLLSYEDFQTAKATLGKAGLPTALAHMFKPWVVTLILAVSDCERKNIASGQRVLDMVVAERARKHKIPVVGLETIQSQLAAAARIPLEEQVEMLRANLRYSDRSNDLMETVIQLYLQRRIGAAVPLQEYLAKQVGADRFTFKGFQRELLVKRNRDMRERALPLLAKGNAFIAVGALHLVGEGGLVALLRNAGYDVTPLE